MRISLIVAVAENGVIGRGGELPWRLSADLQRFKQLTMGHTIIMGRKTWESIGRPLPGRRMIVVTRQAGLSTPRASTCVGSLDEAACDSRKRPATSEAFVIGGAEIYRAGPAAGRSAVPDARARRRRGDTFFPDVRRSDWRLRRIAKHHAADAKNEYPVHASNVYERVDA